METNDPITAVHAVRNFGSGKGKGWKYLVSRGNSTSQNWEKVKIVTEHDTGLDLVLAFHLEHYGEDVPYMMKRQVETARLENKAQNDEKEAGNSSEEDSPVIRRGMEELATSQMRSLSCEIQKVGIESNDDGVSIADNGAPRKLDSQLGRSTTAGTEVLTTTNDRNIDTDTDGLKLSTASKIPSHRMGQQSMLERSGGPLKSSHMFRPSSVADDTESEPDYDMTGRSHTSDNDLDTRTPGEWLSDSKSEIGSHLRMGSGKKSVLSSQRSPDLRLASDCFSPCLEQHANDRHPYRFLGPGYPSPSTANTSLFQYDAPSGEHVKNKLHRAQERTSLHVPDSLANPTIMSNRRYSTASPISPMMGSSDLRGRVGNDDGDTQSHTSSRINNRLFGPANRNSLPPPLSPIFPGSVRREVLGDEGSNSQVRSSSQFSKRFFNPATVESLPALSSPIFSSSLHHRSLGHNTGNSIPVLPSRPPVVANASMLHRGHSFFPQKSTSEDESQDAKNK